jgi:CMP-N,N'-diacetyllegionaminic acid synthase
VRQGRRILVVVPARGGSKGVPLKNLRPVAGTPLVARVGQLVQELDWVDRAVVSTDHAVIAKTARDAGLEAPFYRPEKLSGDRIGDLEVLTHALLACEEDDGQRYDVVVMLQPTSPLRRAEHVSQTLDALLDGDLDSVWTVSPSEVKAHPLKQLRFASGKLELWDPAGAAIIARQQLEPVYHRNGVAYAVTRGCLLEQKTLLGKRASAVIQDEPMISIDTLEDFAAVEAILAARGALPEAAALKAPGDPRPSGPLTFVVDFDGVIGSLVPDNDYARSEPLAGNIARVNRLHRRGHRILIFTARGSATGKDWADVTRQQLLAWDVRFDELCFGKPAADYYVDDRLITLEDAVALTDFDTDTTEDDQV